jgi:serine protease AprX
MASNDLPTRKQIREQLRPTIIAEPLLSQLATDSSVQHHVIIELNSAFPGGLEEAREYVKRIVASRVDGALDRNIDGARYPFVFAELTATQIYAVIDADGEQAAAIQRNFASDERAAPSIARRAFRAIFKIWESARIQPLTIASIKTVKADAALSAFTAAGDRIVWAVLDSGIDRTHPHFVKYDNLKLDLPLAHRNFAAAPAGSRPPDPLEDEFGHGTHVAGIIAGASDASTTKVFAARESIDRNSGGAGYELHDVSGIRGMAPKCKLMSLRVLDGNGGGDVTAVINALEWVIQLNGDGQQPLVHGVNISAGYLPDPEHYGSGQSPVCRQVNRAVRSGLVVVAASGNYGYAAISALQKAGAQTRWNAGQFITITDPGNADLAITVGSTHREEPHRYGISFFSSKGPTSDGRAKPDVVAPGERIVSCAAGTAKQTVQYLMQLPAAGAPGGAPAPGAAPPNFDYVEDSGTSMAAPHVSGVIAAFLSIRREFIGAPEKVASLVTASAMDLGRDARLQGAGLVDLFKMIQQV